MSSDYTIRRSSDIDTVPFDWGTLRWIASGPLDNATGLTVGQCLLNPGQGNPMHMHPNCEEVLHVQEGSIEHDIEGQPSIPMGPGDTITIPPGVYHRARNLGDGVAALWITFSSADRETVMRDA